MKNKALTDTQNSQDERGKFINQVGISNLKYPLTFSDSGKTMQVIANYQMGVSLASNEKGTHMSRFVQVLNNYQNTTFSLKNFEELAEKVVIQLKSDEARIQFDFSWFIEKKAPVSGIKSLLEYEVELVVKKIKNNSQAQKQISVIVPVKSLCPCSKTISDYGAHNQRSYIRLTVIATEELTINTLVQIAEKNCSSELFTLLKRVDEKYITEHAYDNALFVEDIVRDIAITMDKHPFIFEYQINSENIESIHNHSAYAEIESDGFIAI